MVASKGIDRYPGGLNLTGRLQSNGTELKINLGLKLENGKLIQAHGGSILHFDGIFYWFGENKAGRTKPAKPNGPALNRVDVIGISVYSSRDLLNWKNEGLALRGGDGAGHPDLAFRGIVERPRVLYHAASRRFVMWLHIDDEKYKTARLGIAVASKPAGPYIYRRSFRPHGEESRDFTVYQDDDGFAYIAYSSEGNRVMHLARLASTLDDVVPGFERALVGQSRESPVIFKCAGVYFLFTSGCTGWEPNRAEVFYASALLGQTWRSLGDPCVGGASARRTFMAQATFALPVPGSPGRFLLMADRWNQERLGVSRYIWLPLFVVEAPTAERLRAMPAERERSRVRRGDRERVVKPAARAVPADAALGLDVVVRWHHEWDVQTLDVLPQPRSRGQPL
ncbi:hypothetical protein WJX81_000360 [Elliptochloris bilobata]|uniref:Uncharacterized protein n=1 Tax=Elliptochloris bilobata TaxID=381761 RepID=A0AAW1RIE7_9CHLO